MLVDHSANHVQVVDGQVAAADGHDAELAVDQVVVDQLWPSHVTVVSGRLPRLNAVPAGHRQ